MTLVVSSARKVWWGRDILSPFWASTKNMWKNSCGNDDGYKVRSKDTNPVATMPMGKIMASNTDSIISTMR